MKPIIILANHNYGDRCGVYKHGLRMWEILQNSKLYDFILIRANSANEFISKISTYNPSVIIYNYYPGILDWAEISSKINTSNKIPTVGIFHEVTQDIINNLQSYTIFDYWLAVDPSIITKHKWFKTCRPIYDCITDTDTSTYTVPTIPTIGSFGFAFNNKGFERIVCAVCREFKEANIRFHITDAQFSGDITAEQVIHNCKNLIKPGINLEVSTNYIEDIQLVKWLSQNTANCLLYDRNPNRGISSAVDYCVSSKRPLILSDSEQFRHVDLPRYPKNGTLKELIEKCNVTSLCNSWSHANFIKEHEDIISTILNNKKE